MENTSTQEAYRREIDLLRAEKERLKAENTNLKAERDRLQWFARLGEILGEQVVIHPGDGTGYREDGADVSAFTGNSPDHFRFPVGQKEGSDLYATIQWGEEVRREKSRRVLDLLREVANTNEELQAGEEELRQTLEYVVNMNRKLAESEAKYKVLSESSRDLISLHGRGGVFLYVSPSVREILGYEPEELVGQDPFQFYHPDSQEEIRSQLQQQIWQGTPGALIQYRFRHKNGEYVWLETLSQPLPDEKGQTLQIHASSRDISDRKKAERERDNFFNYSLDLMVMLDGEGKMMRVNRRWQDTLGWPPIQLEGKLLFNFLHPDDLQATRATVMQQVRSRQPSLQFENRFRCPDGAYRWLSWFLVILREEKVTYGFAQDITLYRQSEEKLRETLRELQTRNHELDHYVYKVSHDLRAPLCSIKGLVSLLREETEPDTIRHYVELIDQRVDKSDRFIQSVLDHSRMLNTEVQRSSIDFNALIGECFDELKYMDNAGRLRWQVNVVNQVPFYCDAFRLRIVLKNLISNAIKYMNQHRSDNCIWFSVASDAHSLRLQIQDNGIGIDRAYVDRIFSMFFRATERSEGSGLGLYIVKQTIERLGGTITLQSTLDEGTLFNIHLPNLPPSV